ncbi:Thylakoid membrane phosphoprotein 14 kDa [Populus alba x Populus x berolinensis]|nr:Thylakoid membrane phosphoprotein 14 kDa [Populus alba x Populus x berolinensis]
MASTSSTPLSISSSSSLIDAKASRQSAVASPQCVSLPTLPPPPVQPQNRPWKAATYCESRIIHIHVDTSHCISDTQMFCFIHSDFRFLISGRKIARNVMTMATGEAPVEVASAELPEIVKTVQEAWDKVEDKYAVSSLVVAGGVALWGSAGLISAIERLPLIPGALELVGIGYTGVSSIFSIFLF